MKTIITCLLLIFLFSITYSQDYRVTIPTTTDDTSSGYIRVKMLTLNFEKFNNEIYVGKSNFRAFRLFRGFVVFDLSIIPNDAIIDEIILWACVNHESDNHFIYCTHLTEDPRYYEDAEYLFYHIGNGYKLHSEPWAIMQTLGYDDINLDFDYSVFEEWNQNNNWWAIGFYEISEEVDRGIFYGYLDDNPPYCEISYHLPVALEACFTVEDDDICTGDNIQFEDCSSGDPDEWQWVFEGGEPSTSSDQNPVVTYNSAGDFEVTLTVSNEYGSDTLTEPDYIHVEECPVTADFIGYPLSINIGDDVGFTDLSAGDPDITSWDWVFEGGSPSSFEFQQPPNIVYNNAGSYDVTLTVSNGVDYDTAFKPDYIFVDDPPDILNIENLTIYANEITPSGSSFTASGNVVIGPIGTGIKILYFDGDITINTITKKIFGDNGIFLNCIPGYSHFTLYNGNFNFLVSDHTLSDNFSEGLTLLAGLDVFLSDIVVKNNGVELYGQIKFPEIIGGILRDIGPIYLNDNGIDFADTLELDKIEVFDTFSIKDLKITFDSQEDNFEFKGKLRFYKYGINAKAEIIHGNLNSIGIRVGIPIPIPETGFAFNNYGGHVDSIAYPPLELTLITDIETYPTPFEYPFVSFANLYLTYTWKTSIGGGGSLKIYNKTIADAHLNLYFKSKLYDFNGSVNLNDVLLGTVDVSIQKINNNRVLEGESHASLEIPDTTGFPYGLIKAIPGVDLPYTVAGIDGFICNEALAGKFAIFYFRGNYKLTWENNDFKLRLRPGWRNWNEILFGKANIYYQPEKTKLNPLEGKSMLISIDNNAIENDTIIEEFNLTKQTNLMVIRLGSDMQIPYFTIQLPDSSVVTPENSTNYENITYLENSEDNNAYYIFNTPPEGHWKLNFDNNTDSLWLDVFGADLPPAIQLEELLQLSDSAINISWKDEDNDSDAKISLFYDINNKGANGKLIVSDISEDDFIDNYVWDISDMSTGSYYVYGVIEDTSVSPSISYASEPITIISKDAPTPPFDLIGYNYHDTCIYLSWQHNITDPAIRYNVYYSTNEQNLNFNSSSYNIGTLKDYKFKNFLPGKNYYFMITAMDTSFYESDYSNIISVNYVSSILNNTPIIAEQEILGNTYAGEEYEYFLICDDPDGDELEYSLICLHGSDELEDEISINSDGLISWSPDFDDIGYYTIKVFVQDPGGLVDSIDFSLIVLDPVVSTKSLQINSPVYTCYGGRCLISVKDNSLLTSSKNIDNVDIHIFSNLDSTGIILNAKETEPNSKRFVTYAEFTYLTPGYKQIKVDSSDIVTAMFINPYEGDTIYDICYFEYEPFEVSIQKEGDTIFCTGDSLNITLNAYSDDYTSYLWSDGETRTSTFTVPESGMYWVTVSNRRGCIQTSDTVLIGPSLSPEPEISPHDTLRVCDSTILDPGEFPQCTFKWDNGDTTQTTIVTDIGWQKLTVTNQFGCIGVDSVYINKVDQDPVADFYYIVMHPNDFQFCDTSQFPGTYYWDFGDDTIASTSTLQNPSHQYLKDGRYNCMLIITNSCSSDTMIMPIDANYVEDLQLPEIAIHPNPTTGIVSINIAGKIRIGEVRISIIDIVGNKLMEQKDACNTEYSNDFDLSKFSKGVYILNIRSKDWQIIRKIIRK